jgi:hypothetical protein
MGADIRSDLVAAADAESMCRLLRARCERYGRVEAIDLLPLETGSSAGVVCIVDMATAEQANAARSAAELVAFGASSLVCVVPRSSFPLPLPFRYAAPRALAA